MERTVSSSHVTPDPDTGIGKWEKDDIVELLRTGTTPEQSKVKGAMREVIEDDLKYLSDSDLETIADYLFASRQWSRCDREALTLRGRIDHRGARTRAGLSPAGERILPWITRWNCQLPPPLPVAARSLPRCQL
jgi:hypothetical protein